MELWLGTWEGVIDCEPSKGTCHWLRFYDPDENLLPLPEEQERQRADQAEALLVQERQRVETERAELIERLRARGIDPKDLLG